MIEFLGGTMKKKVLLVLGVIIAAVFIFNIATLLKGTNTIYNYVKENYFTDILNLDEQFDVKDYKTNEQKIVVDGYTLTMDQYYFSEDRTRGCFRVRVTNPNYDMRDLETGYESFYLKFGDAQRFKFFHDVNGNDIAEGVDIATYSREYETIKKKDTLYIYYIFSSDKGVLFDGKIYLYDNLTQVTPGKEFDGTSDCACGMFDVSK